jgi:hypothetical protein
MGRPCLSLTIRGEEFEYTFWAVGLSGEDPDTNLEHHREVLLSSLQDFVAESSFGWGELRG